MHSCYGRGLLRGAPKTNGFDAPDRADVDEANHAVIVSVSDEVCPSDRPAMRKAYFERARDSLFEPVSVIDLAQLVGAMDSAHQREVHDLALRVRAMLVALLRR